MILTTVVDPASAGDNGIHWVFNIILTLGAVLFGYLLTKGKTDQEFKYQTLKDQMTEKHKQIDQHIEYTDKRIDATDKALKTVSDTHNAFRVEVIQTMNGIEKNLLAGLGQLSNQIASINNGKN